MTDSQPRRRFLQLTGTGVAASLAGCSQLGITGDDDADEYLTALAEPDPDEMQELQEEAFEGEMGQEEIQQRQMELFEDAIDQFESRVEAESDEDLSIEESEGEMGLYLVDGSADVLIDALRTGDISVLGGGHLYDQLQQQQQPPQGGDEVDEEELEEALEEEMEDAEDDADEEDDGEPDADEEDDADEDDGDADDGGD